MVDWCSRHAGFDKLDPPAVHDLVVDRRRDCHGPAEMMGDAQTHATDYALDRASSVDEALRGGRPAGLEARRDGAAAWHMVHAS